MSDATTEPQLFSLVMATRIIQLGTDILAGRIVALDEARMLAEDILSSALPVGELSPALTPEGVAVGEAVADAAERAKFNCPTCGR